MRSLVDFLVNCKHWFVFIVLEVISLLFLFNRNGYQNSVILTTANDAVGSAYSVVSSVTSYLALQQVNRELEAENQLLRRQLITARERLHEVGVDTTEIRWMPKRYELVSAQVVRSTLHKSNNLITIDKGEADGIRPEMGVVCSRGVVGIVYLTSNHYSVVMPLLNVNSKVSCRLRRTEYFGTLAWNRGNPSVTYATGIPRHAKLKLNDIVETNGYSAIFPPGLPIGTVMQIGNSADGMSYRLKVTLFTDFKTLRDVSVITNYVKPERVLLEEQADSLNQPM